MQFCAPVAPFAAGHAMPPLAAVVIEKVRGWVPVPHVLVHVPHAPHAPTQLTATAHAAVLQFCAFVAAVVATHATPPPEAAVVIEKVRDWMPVPHVLEHVPQRPQLPTQSTAHKAVLQPSDCVAPFRLVHAIPAGLTEAGVETTNVRVKVPEPHVLEHVPHRFHAPTQAMAVPHAPVAQFCDAVVAATVAHAVPPFAAAVVWTNVRAWVPVPQVLVHAPHAFHKPTQATGHKAVLQCCEFKAPFAAMHALPAPVAAVVTLNVRV